MSLIFFLERERKSIDRMQKITYNIGIPHFIYHFLLKVAALCRENTTYQMNHRGYNFGGIMPNPFTTSFVV